MLLKLFLLFLFLPVENTVDCSPECQLEQVNNYFSALDKVYREGSSVGDIEHLLSLLHDEVRYVHIDYGADFDKASWRAAFIVNLERGAYRNGPENEMRISNIIHGKNHAAIEYSHGIVQPDATLEGGEPLLVLFTFTDGKISRIEELW